MRSFCLLLLARHASGSAIGVHRQLFHHNLREGGAWPEYDGDRSLLSIVPPGGHRNDTSEDSPGTTVEVGFFFFKIESVRPTSGEMGLKVWYRLAWQDDRLSWDPSAFGGTSEIQVRASSSSDKENTDIWTPDIVPFNSNEGIAATLDPAVAVVQSSGEVFWSRQGTLSLLCGFSGLNNFPFDELKCPSDVGGWMLDGAVQNVRLFQGTTACQSAALVAPTLAIRGS